MRILARHDMDINIIMPAYNGHRTIRQAISSVASQDALDKIKLTVVDDNSEQPYDYLLKDYHYMNIEVVRKQTNTGCGQSRQYGVDRCNSKYFMFLDTGDCLYSPCVVKQLCELMESEMLDSLYTDFLEELKNGEYRIRKGTTGWMHGKVFRTDYIRSNNIRFNNTRLHEDHAYNIIQLYSGGKNLCENIISYIWKYNESSLTYALNDKSNFMYSMDNYIENAKYTISELIGRGVDVEIIKDVIKKYVISMYRHLNDVIQRGDQNERLLLLQKTRLLIQKFPTDLMGSITYSYMSKDFYKNEPIQDMANRSIIMNVTFKEYCKLIDCCIDN